MSVLKRFALLLAVSAFLHPRVAAAEISGVSFDASPSAAWRCGLANDDLPGLAAEHMRQRVAAGCERGTAKAYAVIVDLSDSRSAMRAEQLAADAEDQLPTSWKIDSKSYDVVTLPGGRAASYSRLVGKGDGFTFLSGNASMVAISVNVPLLFEDETGAPRQAIAVFRVRSPLPAAAGERKDAIAELDRMVRQWASTAQPTSGRSISDRDFELAAYARTKNTGTAAAPPAPSPVAATANDRISTALAAAAGGRATAADLTTLEETANRFPQTALGGMARSYLDDARRSVQQRDADQILTAAIDSAKEGAVDVFSRFLTAAVDNGDAAGAATAVRAARKHGWTLRNASPAAISAVTAAITKRRFPLVLAADDRAFFELPAAEILPLVQAVRTVPRIDDIARADRDRWRLKDRRETPKPVYLVQHDNSVGLLELQQETGKYRFRPMTNVLDLAVLAP